MRIRALTASMHLAWSKRSQCWIHTRRYWYEARDYDKRANVALGYIARLSQIESQLRSSYPELDQQGKRDFEGIANARQKYARPILNEFKTWMETEVNGVGYFRRA